MYANLSLDDETKQQYKRMYSGIFYKRFILGLWVLAESVIYDMFDLEKHSVKTVDRRHTQYYVSVDHGTQTPHLACGVFLMVFGTKLKSIIIVAEKKRSKKRMLNIAAT